MTNIGTIILVLVCVALGYLVEPWFFKLRDADRNKSTMEKKVEPQKEVEKPKPKPVPTVNIDLSLVKPEDFPQEVSLRDSFEIEQGGLKLSLEEGTNVIPVRLEGTNLIFKTKGIDLENSIDVDLTNFKELVLPVMNARLEREEEMRRIEAAKPVILDDAGIISCIKASVQGEGVSEFTPEQVSAWEVAEDMEFDGQTYQVGSVTVEEQTILGPQTNKAIALIENGEVVKWLWAKTKLEVR